MFEDFPTIELEFVGGDTFCISDDVDGIFGGGLNHDITNFKHTGEELIPVLCLLRLFLVNFFIKNFRKSLVHAIKIMKADKLSHLTARTKTIDILVEVRINRTIMRVSQTINISKSKHFKSPSL